MSNRLTNLTDKLWQVMKNIVKTKERKRKCPLCEMIDAMMYIKKTGCQWRMLPKEFGSWQTVYFYFRKWKLEGIFEELMHYLRESVRKAFGKAVGPQCWTYRFQKCKTSYHIDSSEYGIGGGKKVKGRKEHIIVDTIGLPMVAKVHTANIHDSAGAIEPIKQLRYTFPRLKKIIVEGGYGSKLADVVEELGWELSVVFRPDESSKKFQVLPLR